MSGTDQDHELLAIADRDTPSFQWTLKRERFCYFFARTGKITKAAELAGFSAESDWAGKLLDLEPIRARVRQEVRNLLTANSENEETVIARWSNWANADIGDYFEADWQLKDITQLSEEQRRRIKKVKITHNQYGRNIDFELHDAAKANNDLANMFGLLRNEDEDAPAEETAKSIRELLRMMEEADGLTEAESVEPSEGGPGPATTH